MLHTDWWDWLTSSWLSTVLTKNFADWIIWWVLRWKLVGSECYPQKVGEKEIGALNFVITSIYGRSSPSHHYVAEISPAISSYSPVVQLLPHSNWGFSSINNLLAGGKWGHCRRVTGSKAFLQWPSRTVYRFSTVKLGNDRYLGFPH